MPDLYRACRMLLPLLLLALLLPLQGQAEVVFKGLSRTTEKVVRATVVLAAESCTAPDARVRRLYRRADTEIRQALEVYGYYAPTIEKQLGRKGNCWQAQFTVERGPRVTIRSLKLFRYRARVQTTASWPARTHGPTLQSAMGSISVLTTRTR
jgi:hypothetical protein